MFVQYVFTDAGMRKRDGIGNICSSGEYPWDQKQIYRARKKDTVEKETRSGCLANDSTCPAAPDLEQQQQETNEDWFVRDVNISNEQTIFLANKQQLLNVERFFTNPESFSVFFG